MIYCFSGTGNTAMCAQKLARITGDEIVMLSGDSLLDPASCVAEGRGGRIVWAFPTYSWGVPPVMVDFIKKVRGGRGADEVEHFMFTTCGDDMGLMAHQWRKLIEARGWKAAAAYGIVMPNTYVAMKGFDVDKPEVAAAKLTAAPGAVEKIAEDMLADTHADTIIRLSFSWIKTAVIYPWFRRFAMSSKPFRSTEGCVSCGLCAASCPMKNISMDADERPQWGERCAMCLRCYHICPRRAVAYGKTTDGKGQWQSSLKFLKTKS